jgi:thioredoxin-related protein
MCDMSSAKVKEEKNFQKVSKKLNAIIFFILYGSCIVIAQEKNEVNFEYNLNWSQVLAKAKANKKYVFVDLYATWCGPCKTMDRNTFLDSTVRALLNNKFVSVKVQADSTANDNEHVKAWYKDVMKLMSDAKLTAFPTFLFYSSEGELFFKSVGYRDPKSFIDILNFACDSRAYDFKKNIQEYEQGVKNFERMPMMVRLSRELLGNKVLTKKIAGDYKENFLDKLSFQQFLTAEHINFIYDNFTADELNSKDMFFKACYENLVDSIIGKDNVRLITWIIISKEILSNQLYINNQPVTKFPDWHKLEKDIHSSYPKVKAEHIILDEKIRFYHGVYNWDLYSKYKSDQIDSIIVINNNINAFMELNLPAWSLFLTCSDKVALCRALKWSELSIKLETSEEAIVQCLDTKANLLYKLGRISDALIFEEKAIQLSKSNAARNNVAEVPFIIEYENNIKLMRQGVPTW